MEQPTATEQINDSLEKRGFKPSKKWILRGALAILGVIILYEAITLVRTISNPVPSIPAVQPINGGKIVLLSNKNNYVVNENIPIDLKISTGGYSTLGTDVVIKYDPTILDASGATSIRKSDLYTEYPLVTADPTNGLIFISGVSTQNKDSFNGVGIFGTLNLKALKPGTTSLEIQYLPDATNESNVIKVNSAEDILKEVKGITLTIQ